MSWEYSTCSLLMIILHTHVSSGCKMINVEWWHFPPYVQNASSINSTSSNILQESSYLGTLFTGIFPHVLQSMLSNCYGASFTFKQNISLHQPQSYGCFHSFQQNITNNLDPDNVRICLPAWQRKTDAEISSTRMFVPLLEVPGSVHFYKRPEEPVASDLMTVILQGWPMLILILLGAGYSGIIIWLLDRLWNPTNFPKPFIRGFWEGFWWAFVTMTTVGYGDTTPRSIQARLYGLVWIVVGITILSVFTATVTTVLTQESLAMHRSIQGITVGVLNGTDEFRVAITKGAKPIVFPDFAALLQEMNEYKIGGGLVDQYFFASQQHLLTSDILVETLVPNPLWHGFVISGATDQIRQCMNLNIFSQKQTTLTLLNDWIEPITVTTTNIAEAAETLFQPKTVLYMWYGLAVWFLIFLGFVCWEFCYWRPKHIARKEMKAAIDGHKPVPILRINGHMTAAEINRAQARLQRRISSLDMNGCIGRPIKHTYTNKLYVNDEEGKDKTNTEVQTDSNLLQVPVINHTSSPLLLDRLSKVHDIRDSEKSRKELILNVQDVIDLKSTYSLDFPNDFAGRVEKTVDESDNDNCLENMLERQNMEIILLEKDFNGLKRKYAKKLKDLHRKHKAERRRLLDMVRNKNSADIIEDEPEKPCDIIFVKERASKRLHPVSVYSV